MVGDVLGANEGAALGMGEGIGLGAGEGANVGLDADVGFFVSDVVYDDYTMGSSLNLIENL